ncbi:hypothetical protein J6590_035341 [Homalodisca vitripennis]|nr:hypothetical protein J6590_035341 [Homalodisca vitripennis]
MASCDEVFLRSSEVSAYVDNVLNESVNDSGDVDDDTVNINDNNDEISDNNEQSGTSDDDDDNDNKPNLQTWTWTNDTNTVRQINFHVQRKKKEKLKKGEITFRSSNNTLCLKWKDRTDVTMLSTYHKRPDFQEVTSQQESTKQNPVVSLKPKCCCRLQQVYVWGRQAGPKTFPLSSNA